jgi:2-polyprenyl-3-methyl-5-hydroxy-6-metoxy-1,4-benzoquinol methylase
MKTEEPSHRDRGLSAILSKPWVYNLFVNLVDKKRTQVRLVQKYVRTFPGCRILDIGCGTASILSYLPYSIGEYAGFDMNPLYIKSAKKRWRDRTNCRFFCRRVGDAEILETGYYDVVLAVGIVHHLSDNEATYLFNIAHRALKLNGALITYDPVYVENQHWLAKWFISRDRGRAVRTVEDYTRMAVQCFVDIETDILHDALRIPYTIFIMRCIKRSLTKDLSV